MSGILLVIIAMAFYAVAYRFYGAFLSKKFKIEKDRETPSHSMYDGIDYIPAKSPVLLGHHFASIAGAGPIVGPVLAVGFGWLPVYFWVLIGAVLLGGVHDYGAIAASIKHKGKSIAILIDEYIGINAKNLFLIFTWATLILVIAVFALIISDTFISIPSTGSSSLLFILIAVLFGLTVYKLKTPLWIASIIGVALIFISIYLGQLYPITLNKNTWIAILFIYITIASVTPVWILLQPRDYLNSYFLYTLIFLGIGGLFFANPQLNVPSFVTYNLDKIGYLFPALFVTVACGAISGFHSIVGSGTTSKQLDKEPDAQKIGYGGMLIEGILAVLSLVAVASIEPSTLSNLLQEKGAVAAFSHGVAQFIKSIPFISVSFETAQAFVALSVAAFALTTLDTATRLARYTFQEFFEEPTIAKYKFNQALQNRYAATAVTVVLAALLTVSGQSMTLWPIFGSANQLLATLALLALTVWLANLKQNYIFTLIPMLFMYAVTFSALFMIFYENLFEAGNIFLAFLSLLLLLLAFVLGKKAYDVITIKVLEL